jgi:hypothetical protein
MARNPDISMARIIYPSSIWKEVVIKIRNIHPRVIILVFSLRRPFPPRGLLPLIIRDIDQTTGGYKNDQKN